MSDGIAPTVDAVVDLRAYAAGTLPSADWIAGRAQPAFADAAAQVAAIALRGTGRVDTLAQDEFVLVLAGWLVIESAAGSMTITAANAGVLPVGTSFFWRASDDMLAIIYAAPTAAPGSAGAPLLIDTAAPLTPSSPPLAENLIGPTPACRNHSDYLSANTEFVCGTWDSTPYHRRQIPYRQVELMLLIDGSVTFSTEAATVSFAAGDVCLFVRGDGCAWRSSVHVKKIYATQRPVG